MRNEQRAKRAQSIENIGRLENLGKLGRALPTFILKLLTLLKFFKFTNNPPSSQHDPICCQKGLGLAYRKSESLGIVQEVQPEALNFWDGSRMTPFHNKLLEFGSYLLKHILSHRLQIPLRLPTPLLTSASVVQ